MITSSISKRTQTRRSKINAATKKAAFAIVKNDNPKLYKEYKTTKKKLDRIKKQILRSAGPKAKKLVMTAANK